MKGSACIALSALLLVACQEATEPRATPPIGVSRTVIVGDVVYKAIDLGTLGGKGSSSEALAINDDGQVVGLSKMSDGSVRGFLWEDGEMSGLGTLGGNTEAWSINNAGQIVGQSDTEPSPPPESPTDVPHHAFLWRDSKMADLGTLGGVFSRAYGVNDAGQVVGESRTASNETHAFLWENGVMSDLGALGGTSSLAWAINNAGNIVGWIGTGSNEIHAFHLVNGEANDLGTLGGANSWAYSINDVDQIVGASMTASDNLHAFLWENWVMRDLGTLGGRSSEALAINRAGQIVGSSRTTSSEIHTFLWEREVMSDLGTLGGTFSWAWDINYVGHVVGLSETESGEVHAVLWRTLESEEVLEVLETEIQELVDSGEIIAGAAGGLLNQVAVATGLLNDGKTEAAIRLLEAFKESVERLVSRGELGAAQGQSLTGATQAAINQLQG